MKNFFSHFIIGIPQRDFIKITNLRHFFLYSGGSLTFEFGNAKYLISGRYVPGSVHTHCCIQFTAAPPKAPQPLISFRNAHSAPCTSLTLRQIQIPLQKIIFLNIMNGELRIYTKNKLNKREGKMQVLRP